ncbi:T9SS type A sorting domain-containing protein [Acinetobacter sp.]|uniref:T9SS type A sorting domain-containing protein n=1 Tax=Acinetobacter sp. TaxID=472 RepID=UPI003CFEF843
MIKVITLLLLLLNGLTAGELVLSWNQNADKDSVAWYRVYRSIQNMSGFSKFDSVPYPDTAYIDNAGIEQGVFYSYYLDAVNHKNVSSPPSDTVWIVYPVVTTLPPAREPLPTLIGPNPAPGRFVIWTDTGDGAFMRVRVYTMLGELIFTEDRVVGPGLRGIAIELGNIASGQYICRLTIGDDTVTRKLIILK